MPWKTGKDAARSAVQTNCMVLDANDRELVEACQRGEDGAFRALFEAYQDRVYSIALRYSGNPAAAMDIAQDTFLKLLSRIGDYRFKPGNISLSLMDDFAKVVRGEKLAA